MTPDIINTYLDSELASSSGEQGLFKNGFVTWEFFKECLNIARSCYSRSEPCERKEVASIVIELAVFP